MHMHTFESYSRATTLASGCDYLYLLYGGSFPVLCRLVDGDRKHSLDQPEHPARPVSAFPQECR